MISLYDYILESCSLGSRYDIRESGNAISNASRIPVNFAYDIYTEVSDTFSNIYKNIEMCPLGSLGKKRVDQTHGDIDIAVVTTSVEDLREKVRNVFEPLIGDKVTEINYHTTATTVSIGWKFGSDQVAQIDFMTTRDLEWAKFRFDSPDYTKDESQFKGGVRAELLRYIISEIPVEDNDIKYFDDGSLKSKYKYSMKDDGIFKQFIDFTGRNGKPLKNPRKIKELESFISDNPTDIQRYIFGSEANPKDFKSAESLWRAFHDKKKFPYGDDIIKNIETRFEKETLSKLNLSLADFRRIAEK